MAVNVALVKGNVVVNVAVFDETFWDFEAWGRFAAEYDDLVVLDEVEHPDVWIGSARKSAKARFGKWPRPKDPVPDG